MSQSNILDTNVLVVANNKAGKHSSDCQYACAIILKTIKEGIELISVDDKGLIFDEYKRHNSFSGQPGVGDDFFRWLFDIQGNEERCEKATITETHDDKRLFKEIPPGEFDEFHRKDQKFLAVAFASQYLVTIRNAADSDWNDIQEKLEKFNIGFNQIC